MDDRLLLPERDRVSRHPAERVVPAGGLPAGDDGAAHPAHPQRLPARVHRHRRRGDLPRHHHHVPPPQDGVHG